MARPNENIERYNRIKIIIDSAKQQKTGKFIDGLYAKQTKLLAHKADSFKPIGLPGRFILQRMLGMKDLMPGSGQWYESSDISVPNSQHYKHDCWVCEGHVYSCLFWSKKHAFQIGPLFTSSGGRGKEAELIKSAVDKFPSGFVETVTK